jgi:hypothetical protein
MGDLNRTKTPGDRTKSTAGMHGVYAGSVAARLRQNEFPVKARVEKSAIAEDDIPNFRNVNDQPDRA